MRTLKYAILGLVCREPITGYDITKEFNNNKLANFWYAKHSQVYPELSRLLDEGSLTCEVMIQGEKMEKKLYSITELGKKELMEWLLEDEPLGPTPKDVFRLRTYFSDFMSRDELKTHLLSQIDKHEAKREYLKNIMLSNYPSCPGLMSKEFADYMVLDGAILREDSYILWLKRCLERLGYTV